MARLFKSDTYLQIKRVTFSAKEMFSTTAFKSTCYIIYIMLQLDKYRGDSAIHKTEFGKINFQSKIILIWKMDLSNQSI